MTRSESWWLAFYIAAAFGYIGAYALAIHII